MTGADLTTFLKRHPIGAICFLVALACGLTYYFRSSILEDIHADYDTASQREKVVSNDLLNGTNLPQQVEQAQQAVKQLEDRLVHASQLATNLQYFYRLEGDTNVRLLDVRQLPVGKPKFAGPKGTYTAVPFAITIQGDFHQVMSFIAHLEKGSRFCRLNSVNFSKIDKDGNNQLIASLSLELLGTL